MTSFVRPVHALALLACCLALAGCLGDGKSQGALAAAAAAAAAAAPGGTAGNRAPAITGTPVTLAKTNQPYAFQPTASDPDGDALTFTVQNRPAWATFDPKTGRLAGTPSSSYTGTFAGIRINASDGKSQSTLPSFAITVASTTATGIATVSWQPPTENVDGSPLTNLAGYVIRYGTSVNTLSQEIRIANPGITSSLVENLAPATWYFTVSAFTTTGAESSPSTPASKTVVGT
jgi:hypothetical protein